MKKLTKLPALPITGFAQNFRLLPTLLFLLLNAPVFGAVCYVNAAAAGGGNGNSWATAFQGLQDAIDIASPGDMIWVVQGTYKPTKDPSGNASPSDPRDRTFYLKNDVAVFGGFLGTETMLGQRNWATNTTILSGDFNNDDVVTGIGSTLTISNNEEDAYHVVLTVNDNLSSGIDGFTIKGGCSTGIGEIIVESQLVSQYEGGGLFCMSPLTIANCTFFGNQTSYAGGGMVNRSAPVLTNCSFVKNYGESNGGGLANKVSGSPTLSGCLFNGNRSNVGGGMYNINNSPATLVDCTFTENAAGSFGGGMHSSNSCPPMLTNCVFKGNTGGVRGGGMGIDATCSPVLTNCLFSGNFSGPYPGNGGAIYNDSNPVLTNCTIVGNNAANSGGGIFNGINAAPVLKNCILWGNNSEIVGAATVTFSDVQGGHAGTGNINADPLFVAQPSFNNAPTTTGNLHLNCSPVVNAGSLVGAPSFDLDNLPRPVNLIIDMGAFEFQTDCIPVLPIELVSFFGKADGRNVVLSWQTASELANDHFEIEHSEDGAYFKTIGTVKSLGNSAQPQQYGFVHKNPAPGMNFYSLKQVDFDGKISQSKTITVHIEGNEINLFPNPTTGVVEIKGNDLGEEFSVRVMDGLGRTVTEKVLPEATKLDLANLPTGAYLVEIRTVRQTFVKRIFKD